MVFDIQQEPSPVITLIDSSGNTTHVRTFGAGVHNPRGKFVRTARDCIAGINLRDRGTGQLPWVSYTSEEVKLNERQSLLSPRDVLEALLQDANAVLKVDLHRGMGRDFLLAFALESTGKVYLATMRGDRANPLPLVGPSDQPDLKGGIWVRLLVSGVNFDTVISQTGMLLDRGWKDTVFGYVAKAEKLKIKNLSDLRRAIEKKLKRRRP